MIKESHFVIEDDKGDSFVSRELFLGDGKFKLIVTTDFENLPPEEKKAYFSAIDIFREEYTKEELAKRLPGSRIDKITLGNGTFGTVYDLSNTPPLAAKYIESASGTYNVDSILERHAHTMRLFDGYGLPEYIHLPKFYGAVNFNGFDPLEYAYKSIETGDNGGTNRDILTNGNGIYTDTDSSDSTNYPSKIRLKTPDWIIMEKVTDSLSIDEIIKIYDKNSQIKEEKKLLFECMLGQLGVDRDTFINHARSLYLSSKIQLDTVAEAYIKDVGYEGSLLPDMVQKNILLRCPKEAKNLKDLEIWIIDQ